jgi:uncharacterized Tic20 family protein
MAILKHIRPAYLLGWLVAWNAVLGVGMWLDKQNPEGIAFSVSCGIASIATSMLCLSVLFSPTAQSIAVRPATNLTALRKELGFVCVLTFCLGLAAFLGAVAS